MNKTTISIFILTMGLALIRLSADGSFAQAVEEEPVPVAAETSFAQYTIQQVIFDLNDANNAIVRFVNTGNFSECTRADALMERADIAIDQILRERTKRGCVDGDLNNLEAQAARLAGLDMQLEGLCRMRRTYENTLVNVRSWQDIRRCTDPQYPFRITGVVHASHVIAGGGRESLSVHWQGNPTFPVRMNYFNVGTCPPPYTCYNVGQTFNVRANPLIFNGALWCDRVAEPGSYFFNYAVQLVDANGNTTQQESASFNCINKKQP